jgi:hypothetical protein
MIHDVCIDTVGYPERVKARHGDEKHGRAMGTISLHSIRKSCATHPSIGIELLYSFIQFYAAVTR